MTKKKILLEIVGINILIWLIALVSNHIALPLSDNLIIILSYGIESLVVCLCVVWLDREPLSSVGLKLPSAVDVLGGFGLGIILFLVQTAPPVLLMRMDISGFGSRPDFSDIALRFILYLFTVGLAEELVFRGYLRHKLEQLSSSRILVVFILCILFYVSHLPQSMAVDWTHIYSTFATTILFCVYYYLTPRKSLVPLIIAHALYDALVGAQGFAIWNILLG